MAQQTDPLASGLSTSEGKLTIALCLIGLALEAFAVSLKDAAEVHPNVHWLAMTALVVGAAVQVLALLGYTKNRSALKSNALTTALAAGVPLVVTAISQAVLKNVKDPAPAAVSAGLDAATKPTTPTLIQTATVTPTKPPTP